MGDTGHSIRKIEFGPWIQELTTEAEAEGHLLSGILLRPGLEQSGQLARNPGTRGHVSVTSDC